ncbi:MAG: LacI family DNA-binding transcriptional regulator [Chloroflexi bacterium]|nr:LacI family DNA-binding transcriptional regulator [Chloroflexota bacterium]
MRSGKPTIRDVARQAGAGVGTVSRVLNENRHVSIETRRRVLEAIDHLGFRPDRTARGLVKGTTQTLGVLVPFFTKHYFLEILRGIQQSVSANDYSLIVYNVERPEQAVAHLDFLAKTRRVDALVIIALGGRLIAEVYGETPPIPIAGVDTEVLGATNLLPDHETGMYLAIRHLAQLGHERIALIDRPQDPVSGTVSAARQKGYVKACKQAGLAVPEPYRVLADYSQEGGYEAARRLLELAQPPTALACASDLQAIGAMKAVEERGLRVGGEVAVTGYHDVELAKYVGLTTVRVPAADMGEAAASLLARILAGRTAEIAATSFSPELVVRRSCGASLESDRKEPAPSGRVGVAAEIPTND